MVIHLFFPISTAIFHAVFFSESFKLSMTKHGQSGHGDHHSTDAKIFIIFAKLCHSSFFIGIVHEVHVTFQNFRVEFQCLFNDIAVFGVFFIFQHIHECAVVNAVHAQGTNKIAFHEPESFCEQQRIGNFFSDAVNNFTPEFFGNLCIKISFGFSAFRPGRDIAACPGFGKPQSLQMFFSQGHCRIKTDDRSTPCHVKNRLNGCFTNFRVEVV